MSRQVMDSQTYGGLTAVQMEPNVVLTFDGTYGINEVSLVPDGIKIIGTDGTVTYAAQIDVNVRTKEVTLHDITDRI